MDHRGSQATRRRGKEVKKAEIVDRGGVTTFWSTPNGLYENWRSARDRYVGSQLEARPAAVVGTSFLISLARLSFNCGEVGGEAVALEGSVVAESRFCNLSP